MVVGSHHAGCNAMQWSRDPDGRERLLKFRGLFRSLFNFYCSKYPLASARGGNTAAALQPRRGKEVVGSKVKEERQQWMQRLKTLHGSYSPTTTLRESTRPLPTTATTTSSLPSSDFEFVSNGGDIADLYMTTASTKSNQEASAPDPKHASRLQMEGSHAIVLANSAATEASFRSEGPDGSDAGSDASWSSATEDGEYGFGWRTSHSPKHSMSRRKARRRRRCRMSDSSWLCFVREANLAKVRRSSFLLCSLPLLEHSSTQLGVSPRTALIVMFAVASRRRYLSAAPTDFVEEFPRPGRHAEVYMHFRDFLRALLWVVALSLPKGVEPRPKQLVSAILSHFSEALDHDRMDYITGCGKGRVSKHCAFELDGVANTCAAAITARSCTSAVSNPW